tara:strand:+ start:6891 stop:10916 length:4026 start_codon:yes stop_codon:yes gene_type:complete
MACKFNYKGKDYTEAELIKVLSSDPKIVEEYFPQEERAKSDYTKEDIEIFKNKVKILQDSMNVEVIMDDTVESSRVLGKGDQRVKDAGRPVILINPGKIFKTTAIHEFGHIFVDSLPGGLDNPRLKRALDMLMGTELEAEVRELYPELNEEMFAKELIVTAIGRKGAELFDSQDKAGIWESIKNWFFSFISRKFNIFNKDVIESLTRDIIDNRVKKTNLYEGLSEMDQEERVRKIDKEAQEEKVAIKSLEAVFEETLARVTNIYNEYLPDTPDKKERESLNQLDGTTRFQSIEALKNELDKLDETDKKLGLSKYIQWVREEIEEVNRIVDDRKKFGNLTEDNVISSIEWNQGFSMVEDIQSLIIGMNDAGELSDKDKKYYERVLSNVQKDRSKLDAKLLHASREAYAEFMADNDNKIKTEYTKGFEREYDDLDLKASGQSIDSYVMEKLLVNADEIRKVAYNEAFANAQKSVSDIHKLAATMWSEKNANSQDIQVLSTLVDSVEQQIAEYALTQAREFDTMNKQFKKDVSNNNNQKKKYENMFTTSKSGQSYYASQYKPDFMEKRNELISDAFDRDKADEKYGDVKVDSSKLKYTINGVTRSIRFGDATRFKVDTNEAGESIQISYVLLGEREYIPTSEAIARSEYEYWIKENTESIVVKGKDNWVPKQKWINKDYNKMTPKQKSHLDFLKGKVKDADKLSKGKDTLISRSYNQEWIRLPGVLKSDVQRIVEGDYLGAVKHKVSEITSVQADDYQTQENNNTTKESFIRVYADISNKEKLRVPISFRKKLSEADQSFDLHTMTLMNTIAAKNYEKKKEVESTFLIVLEVMKNRKVPDKAGLRRLTKIHALSKKDKEVEIFKDLRDGLPNDGKKALDMLHNRMYDIKSKDAGKVKIAGKEADVNQLAKSWLKYSGMTALVGNWINSTVNLSMGTINNFIEASGGEHFNFKDWAYASKVYTKDVRHIMNDWGSNVDKSRTNMFLNTFNVMGGKEYLDNKFEENTKGQALMKMNSMRPIAKAGEHMMQSKVMYATMRHIRVMNKKGDYIDIDGNVVKSKKEAASLDQMITFVPTTGGGIEMKLNEAVKATTFTRTGGQAQIMLETRNLIKYKIRELHGNYDSDLQAAAQREFWGKLTFFLRKWIEEGYFRRWRGTGTMFTKNEDMLEANRFYSQDAKGNREGYYVTAIRFMSRVIAPAIRQMSIEIIKKGAGNLSTHEKANLKKITTELMIIALSMIAYMSFEDDEEEVTMKYIFRRQISELTFFMIPQEAIKIVSTPTASVGTLRNVLNLMTKAMNPYETYEQGPHKGRNKLTVSALKAFPITSQTNKDIKSALDYLNNSAGF